MSDHHHHHSGSNLKLAFFLNLGFALVEIIGGFYVNSVAIISDAVHDLGDSLSIGSAWYLDKKSRQKADGKYSFGYQRMSLLGALINCLVLILGSVFVIIEATKRLFAPQDVNAQGMILLAILGVIVNGYAAWKVSKGSSLNEETISWHLLEDVLGWLAVLIGAVIMYFYYIPWLDSVLSLAIAFFILYNIIKRLVKVLHILLQGVPKNINLDQIESNILKIKGVDSLHNLNVWSLDGEKLVFSVHVRVKDFIEAAEYPNIKQSIIALLEKQHLEFCTIQIERRAEFCTFEKAD